MASSAIYTAPSIPASASRAATPTQPRPGFFARLVHKLAASRQRQADEAIARLIDLNGGKITDSLERQIERRYLPY